MVRRGSGAAKWRAVLKECAASGLSQVEFARQRRISLYSLRWWKWNLSRRSNGAELSVAAGTGRRRTIESDAAKTLPPFLPVTVVTRAGVHPASTAPSLEHVSGDATLEVVLQSGRRIAVRGDFEGPLLVKLVQTLEKLP